MVKAHPAYSGTIMNATFQIARDLGWDYLEKLAKQRVMQVQSATDTPKKIALGERAVMVDGAGYFVIQLQGGGPAGRDHLSGRGHAARHRPERSVQAPRRIRTRRACFRTGCTRARPSSSWSIAPGNIRRTRRPWRSPDSQLGEHQADEGGSRRTSNRRATRSRRATPRCSGCSE